MRILGLDVGDKKIGISMCDPDEILASPLTTIKRDDDNRVISEILEIININRIGMIVIGMPYSLSGEQNIQALKTKEFADRLRGSANVEIVFQDERLSTRAAQQMMISSGIKKEKRNEMIDSAAAAVLLQGFIDTRKLQENL